MMRDEGVQPKEENISVGTDHKLTTRSVVTLLLIAAVLFGFMLGSGYASLVGLPKVIPMSTSTPTMVTGSMVTPIVTQAVVNLNPYIEKGVVYYVKNNGEKIVVARSVDDPKNPAANIGYRKAILSPDRRFIALGSVGWEAVSLEVYDISTGKIHQTNATGLDYGHWLYDDRLLVIGQCGMGIECGIFLSKDGNQPWIMEQVGDPPGTN